MKLETIVYEKKGAIAYVTLNRPEKLNAMNARLHGELAWAWADFRDDADLRVAITTRRVGVLSQHRCDVGMQLEGRDGQLRRVLSLRPRPPDVDHRAARLEIVQD